MQRLGLVASLHSTVPYILKSGRRLSVTKHSRCGNTATLFKAVSDGGDLRSPRALVVFVEIRRVAGFPRLLHMMHGSPWRPCWGPAAWPWPHHSSAPAWFLPDPQLQTRQLFSSRTRTTVTITRDYLELAFEKGRQKKKEILIFRTKANTAYWVKCWWWELGLTVVLAEYERVHAPQAKHVEEVPRGWADPAGKSRTDSHHSEQIIKSSKVLLRAQAFSTSAGRTFRSY